jgi:molecular chaperone HtpG
MKDMARTGGGMAMMGSMPDQYQVAVNANHPIINKILSSKKQPTREKYARQAFDLALLSQGMLEGKNLTHFIQRTAEILSK